MRLVYENLYNQVNFFYFYYGLFIANFWFKIDWWNIITLHLSDDELIRRRKKWKKQPLKVTKGSLFKYANVVSSASLGCVTDEFN